MTITKGQGGQGGQEGQRGQCIVPQPRPFPTIVPHRLSSSIIVFALLLSGAWDPATAQSIADGAAAVKNGQVRFSFAARDGVCGDGDRISTHSRTDDWEGPCEPGPARVAIDVENGVVVDIDTYVGGRWLPRVGAADLGMVSVMEATDYLLLLAETSSGDISERAIFPATIADSVEVWPRLLRLAKDDSRPREARKAAVFWVSIIAGEVAVGDLEELVTDHDADYEVREVALMGLSQLPESRGVPVLLDVARTSTDREMRRKAIFWLGQTGDPRAIALFEEILTARH